MAAQLGTVASKLIEKAVSSANSRRRRSRVMKMNELQTKIEEFHKLLGDVGKRQQNDQDRVTFKNVLGDAEKRQQYDKEVKDWLFRVKDVYYEVIDVCEVLRTEEMRRGKPLCAVQIRDEADWAVRMTGSILREVQDLSREIDKLELKPMVRVFAIPYLLFSNIY